MALTLLACSSWRVQPVTPEQADLIISREPKDIRVQRPDGRRLVLFGPRVVGDSVIGLVRGQSTALALSDITSVGVPRPSPFWKTMGDLVHIGAGAVLW